MVVKREAPAVRLLSKIKINDRSGCWDWLGCKFSTGYGQIKLGGKKRTTHRFSYELHRGAIPSGQCVCHRCDNPGCVNPDHLFLGTDADNVADKVAKGRQAQGITHGLAKLTESDVLAIRAAVGVTQQNLAERHGVTQSAISLIRLGKNWPKGTT